MDKFIPLSVPNLRGNELKYITEAIEEEWVSTAGPFINQFEEKISEYVQVKNAVACQSGTAGLHLALLACGVSKGEEVIVPTLTFVAAVNPVRYVGAEPVFMDCDDHLTMDADKLESFLENECEWNGDTVVNKRTKKRIKAVIVVHVFGDIADLDRICAITEKYHLKLIEDATEALGSYAYDEKGNLYYAGTRGDVGVYSFNGNKIITTGGGGMVVSNNEEYAKKIRYLSTQAKDDTLYFVHNEIGYNYRMTNIQAAIGLAQLEQLEAFIETKKNNYEEYKTQGISVKSFREDIRPNYWFYSYETEQRDDLMQYLSENKIQSRPVWKLIHTQEAYKNNQTYKIEKALNYYEQILNIPCSSNLKLEEVAKVSKCIKEFEKINNK